MYKFKLEYRETPSSGWRQTYAVIEESRGLLCTLQLSVGRCCSFNVMESVSAKLWHPKCELPNFHQELKQFLKNTFMRSRYDDAWKKEGFFLEHVPCFKVNQFFWFQNSTIEVSKEFVKMCEWQGASEPDHKTTMYMYSFGE